MATIPAGKKHVGPISAGFRGSPFNRVPVSAEDREAIIAALKSGTKACEVARQYCRGESTIRDIARIAGLTKPLPQRVAWRKKTAQEICVPLPAPAVELLELAAKRRRISASALMAQIIVGVLMRGSIDKPPDVDHAIALCSDYLKKRETAEASESLRV
jgi:hypothetical protein